MSLAGAVLVSTLAGFIPSTKNFDTVHTAPFHPRIHNLGNVGYWGSVHASGAQFVTDLIDVVAYGGKNMRKELAEGMATLFPATHKVLEVGCGVGTLTQHLASHFDFVEAVDTSEEMLEVARKREHKGVTYSKKNGADVTDLDFDIAVCCMVFHELPKVAHVAILHSLIAATTGDVLIVDIDPSYTPSFMMLAGEPYVPSYLEHIENTISEVCEEKGCWYDTFSIVEGHVRGWRIRKQ